MALDTLPKQRWTPAAAAHLLHRAGFGGSPSAIEALHRLGHAGAVESLLVFPPGDGGMADPSWANAFSARRDAGLEPGALRLLTESEREQRREVYRRLEMVRIFDLRAWWLHRMRHTPAPLQEKMTLFFHGHFATGFEKVRSAYAMFVQNQTFRRHATGNWRSLLEAVTRDPAMLIYLDGVENTKDAPNENYAREVMELFTLGEGHYSESDIREAARAFTGWRFNRPGFTFEFVPRRHDAGSKTFMGKRGSYAAEDVIGLILEQPQAARWLAAKLWTFFAYEHPEPAVIDALARVLRKHRYELRPALEAMFMSRAFYGERAVRRQVKSPVQWLVGASHHLEAPLPDPAVSLPLLASLGQALFDPPNVKGWDGGVAWITTSSLALRYRAAERLLAGRDGARVRIRQASRREEVAELARLAGIEVALPDEETPWLAPAPDTANGWDRLLGAELRASRAALLEAWMWRLFQSGLRDRDRERFAAYLDGLPSPDAWGSRDCAALLAAMINSPQYQLT